MKLMLNGAPPSAPYDRRQRGDRAGSRGGEQLHLRRTVEELRDLQGYNPRAIYEENARIRRAVDALTLFGEPEAWKRGARAP